ncbi:MAG: thioredoxin family protein [Litoreibacter sp.]|nr:thioredoxin family protein [Litoreibacter sp.]MCY4334912.1 thioredoxin family protein [Litoreibacter sp.]
MKRRHLLAAAFAATLAPFSAMAANFVDYTPGVIEDALAEGKTVFVDFSASWCSTCRRQERVINAIRSEDPAYDAAMKFVKVDWDTYKSAAVTTDRAIPRRSTLLVLRGDAELGRIVAGTSQSQIKALMDKGLKAPAS